jgi:hypothetical protein
LKDGAENRGVQSACRESDDGQGRDRLPTHGVDIAEGIGGCDGTERIRVVDNW